MKLFFAEFPANYDRYYFPYQVLLKRGKRDNVGKIYQMGFFPFRSIKNFFYLARSTRVALDKFKLSSENRRILRKTEEFKFRLVKLDEFDYTPRVQKTCKDWFNQKFGKGKISAAAIRKIFTDSIFTHVFVWSLNRQTVGYSVVFINGGLLHHAHVFYDPDLTKANLGARMILQSIIWAKDNSKKYAYLGTSYSKSALYKTEFSGFEFFNGFSWSDNIEELKYLIERNGESYLFQDKEFLGKFYGGKGIG